MAPIFRCPHLKPRVHWHSLLSVPFHNNTRQLFPRAMILQSQRTRQRPGWKIAFILVLALCLALTQASNDEYLQEVLDEAAQNEHSNDHYAYDDADAEKIQHQKEEEAQRREQAEAERRAAEEERMAEQERIAKEKLQREREAAFEAELARMNDEEQKEALKQKRKDAKVVKRILRAAGRGNLYGILGLRNWEVQLAQRPFKLGPYEFSLPFKSLFHIPPKAIKRAYRVAAKLVHPDKNRDGRAVEAFVAVEEAASILGDDTKRAIYDEEVRLRQAERNKAVKQVVGGTVSKALGVVRRVISIVRRVLGPFAFPIFILTALII